MKGRYKRKLSKALKSHRTKWAKAHFGGLGMSLSYRQGDWLPHTRHYEQMLAMLGIHK